MTVFIDDPECVEAAPVVHGDQLLPHLLDLPGSLYLPLQHAHDSVLYVIAERALLALMLPRLPIVVVLHRAVVRSLVGVCRRGQH